MVIQQGSVAPEAIILDHLLSLLLDKNDLGFSSKGKNGGMPEAILGFKIVFIDRIVMRNMAIVAVGPLPVRTVIPGGILWCHDVAVHTGGRIIRQIGVCPGNIKYIDEKPGQDTGNDHYRNPPTWGRSELSRKLYQGASFVLFTRSFKVTSPVLLRNLFTPGATATAWCAVRGCFTPSILRIPAPSST